MRRFQKILLIGSMITIISALSFTIFAASDRDTQPAAENGRLASFEKNAKPFFQNPSQAGCSRRNGSNPQREQRPSEFPYCDGLQENCPNIGDPNPACGHRNNNQNNNNSNNRNNNPSSGSNRQRGSCCA